MRDEQLIVKFYTEAVWNDEKEEDLPVVFIRKRIRGQDLETFHRKATDQDFKDYEPEYEAFIKREDVVTKGTDLIHLGLLEARIESLKKLEIYTVEQLALLPEQIFPNLGLGGRQIVQKAKSFIAAGTSVTDDFSQERKQLLERIAKLEAKPESKPKRVMSPEHKAAIKAGQERAKKKRDGKIPPEELHELAATG